MNKTGFRWLLRTQKRLLILIPLDFHHCEKIAEIIKLRRRKVLLGVTLKDSRPWSVDHCLWTCAEGAHHALCNAQWSKPPDFLAARRQTEKWGWQKTGIQWKSTVWGNNARYASCSLGANFKLFPHLPVVPISSKHVRNGHCWMWWFFLPLSIFLYTKDLSN